MKSVLIGSLISAVAASKCTDDQVNAMMQQLRLGMGFEDPTQFVTAAAYNEAVMANVGVLPYPCAECTGPYLDAEFEASGVPTGPCVDDQESEACSDARRAAMTAVDECVISMGNEEDTTTASSAEMLSTALVAAAIFAALH